MAWQWTANDSGHLELDYGCIHIAVRSYMACLIFHSCLHSTERWFGRRVALDELIFSWNISMFILPQTRCVVDLNVKASLALLRSFPSI